MNQTDRIELVGVVIRGLLAVVVIIGGGILAYLKPDTQSAVFGIAGGVISFYFLSGVQTGAVNSTLKSLQAQGVIPPSNTKLPVQKGN